MKITFNITNIKHLVCVYKKKNETLGYNINKANKVHIVIK
jgi:hypothetical protein